MLRLPEILWFMLGRAGLNVTTNGTLSDSCLVDVLRAWLLDWNKAYFVYFLLAETVFISSVNEMCGECVETFVKDIICQANSSLS